MVLAAIDIGSNAVRLLIKNLNFNSEGKPELSQALFLRVPLRLGFEVFNYGKLRDEKSIEFLRTIKAFKQLMRVYHVDEYRACATAAMRDAKNGSELIRRIRKATGVKIEIISGQEESQIVYDNHLQMMSEKGDLLFVDVGGGSTEVSFVSEGVRKSSKSYNIGTVRLLSGTVDDGVKDEMRRDIEKLRSEVKNIQIVGSGGNIYRLYKLALLESKRDPNGQLSVSELLKVYDKLRPLTVAERMKKYGMKPDRADVIVPAAEIFLDVSSYIGAETILVPRLGLVDGILLDLVAKNVVR